MIKFVIKGGSGREGRWGGEDSPYFVYTLRQKKTVEDRIPSKWLDVETNCECEGIFCLTVIVFRTNIRRGKFTKLS